MRSLSFENEQNHVEEELHDEDTDETHFEDQTNVFTSEFTAELTSMVDENPYEKDHSDQSDENIGLGFLFKGIEQDEFLANDGLTSTVSQRHWNLYKQMKIHFIQTSRHCVFG